MWPHAKSRASASGISGNQYFCLDKSKPPTAKRRQTAQIARSDGSLSITSKRKACGLMTESNITLGFSGAARAHASYVAGNTMKRMLSPRPLQAIVMRAVAYHLLLRILLMFALQAFVASPSLPSTVGPRKGRGRMISRLTG